MFKFASNLGLRSRVQQLRRLNLSQLKLKSFGIQALVSGVFLFGSQYQLYQMNKNAQNFSKDQFQNPNQIEGLEIEEWSESLYNKYKSEKYDIVILIEPDRFREDFLFELKEFMKKFQEFQGIIKGRPVKFLQISWSSRKELDSFTSKYNCKVERDTLFLLQNQYLDTFYSFGSYDWFENKTYFFKYFKSITKLNKQNYDQFEGNLNTLTYENVVILGYSPSDNKDYENHTKKFGVLSLLKEYSDNPNIHLMFINDKQTAENLGIKEEGQLYLFQKSSKFNYKEHDVELSGKKWKVTKSSSLNDTLFKILQQNAEAYQKHNIFGARSFDKDYSKYSIVLETNENKLSKSDKNKLIDLMGKFNKKLQEIEKSENKQFEVQLVHVCRHNTQRKYTIYIRDDIKTMDKAKAHQMYDIKEVKALKMDDKPHSYIYNYPDEQPLEADSLYNWFQEVQDGKGKESFKSQDAPFYRKFSRKLVGSSFKKDIVENPQNQAVFFYSKNCHACRQYGAVYEQLGLQSIIDKKPIEFNRMNSDFNTLDSGENFPYTPVFQVYKNGAKYKPYVYRHEKFTPDLLKEFLHITSEFQLIPEQQFEKIYQNHQKIDFTEA